MNLRRMLVIALAALLACAPAMAAGNMTIGYISASSSNPNPFVCVERDIISANSLVYESLFEPDGNMQPQGVLAENWTRDGKNWTIYLRSGVYFHNGIELVAQDVVDSYNGFLLAGKENPYYGRLDLITDMSVIDTFTVSVTARYSGMLTMYALTFPVVQRDTMSLSVPSGTGPYMYTNYQDSASMALTANTRWWKQQPMITELNFVHYWDIKDMLSALQSGEIDMFQTRSYAAALTKKLSYATSLDYPTSTYEMLAPNLSGELSDLNVRKAIMYAIDYNTLISNVYLDMAQQCEVPVQPGSWLYESRSAVYYYSPERALQYLNDAGWTDLTGDTMVNKVESSMLKYLTVEIITYDDASSGVRGNAAGQIAENLRAVGIDARVSVLTLAKFKQRLKDRDFGMALMAVNLSETPNLIPLLSKDGAVNYSRVNSDVLNDLLGATVTATTEAEMVSAFSGLEMYIVENLPMMGVAFRSGMVLSTHNLAGLYGARESDAYNGMEFLSE